MFNNIVNWANKIDMSSDVAHAAYNGEMDKDVTFVYINVKTGKETERHFSLEYAIKLAEERANDKRYKNFEYYIY